MALLDELKARGAYETGHWSLKSGRHAATFLQCTPAFTDTAFVRRVGRQLADSVRALAVDVVVSPALTSTLLAFAVADALAVPMRWYEEVDEHHLLRRGQRIRQGERVLLVEDVLTTGRSATAVTEDVADAGATVVGVAALVDRSTGDLPLPFEATSLVQVELETWLPAGCPLCADDVPLADPRA